MRRFFSLSVALLALFSLTGSSAVAQSTEAALTKRLSGRQFLLRGCWQGANLWFTADGRPLNDYPELPFTLAGVKIDHIKLLKNGLQLEGHRMGLEIDAKARGAIRWVPILTLAEAPADRSGAEPLQFHISPPSSGDYAAALDAIFADSVNDLAPRLPIYWQTAATQFFGHNEPPLPEASRLRGPDLKHYASLGTFSGQDQNQTTSGSSTQPTLLSGANPDFTPAARRLKYAAVVIVRFTVNADGSVSKPQIAQPAGLGLDEAAVAAVLQYRFRPGMVNGKPQATEIGTAIRFQMH
ncbi:energy transducer TonB [Terriglobus albidus]|uniref:Energy transducer TonB n=1 Tax=Terriglobus albidus TaxID=1592106 RepID=A0A5B9E630_9BACT|nr:energy transducer TonB [Terriglobus albidus]QEE27733.1 energy transducer TonB [Terriglobus albidus]